MLMRNKWVRNESCPSCGSKDNLNVYADGYKECQTPECGYYEKSSGNYKGQKMNKEINYERIMPPSDGWMQAKLINHDVIVNYGVTQYKDERGKEWVVFPTFVDNVPVGYKKRLLRDEKGQMVWNTKQIFWGKSETKPGLFGLQTTREGKEGLIITEGELDAMAAYQMYGLKYDCISITKGAKSAKNSILQHVELIKSYKEIIICFDSDEPGQIAADEVISALPAGRVKLCNLPLKDAFDMLKADRDKDFRECIKQSKSFSPTTLLTGDALAEAAIRGMRESLKKGMSSGWKSLDALSGGIKEGELITIVAGTGIGKTSFTLNLSYNLMSQDNHIMFMPLEMPLHTILSRYYEIHTGNSIYTSEGIKYPDDYDQVVRQITKDITVFKEIGSVTMEKICDDIRFAASANGVRCVVLDHKDAAICTLGEGANDYKAIDSLMSNLKKVAIETNVCILLVTHQSRSSEDKDDNKASLNRVRGSQGVAQNSDMVIGLERKRDSNITLVKTLKAHRLLGKYGEFELEYDHDTKRMTEVTLNEIQQEDYDFSGDNIQDITRSGGSTNQSLPIVRSSEVEVREDVQSRLCVSDIEREDNISGSEGLHEWPGQVEDGISEEEQPRPRHTDNVSEPQLKVEQEVEVNIRNVGREARISMVQESRNSPGVDAPLIALDLETKGFIEKGVVPEIVCYSVCNEEMSYVVEGTDGLDGILSRYVPVFHNASFDVAVLRGHGFQVDKFHDTMILANFINSNREVSLESLCEELEIKNAKIKFDMKSWAKEGFSYTEELADYAKRDTQATWELWNVLNSQVTEIELKLYNEVELQYCEIVMEMEKTGFYLDVDGAIDFATSLAKKIKEVENKITQQFSAFPKEKTYKREQENLELLRVEPRTDGKEGNQYVYRVYEPFNPGSNDHKAWALMEQGWKPDVFTSTGKPKVDEGILSSLANKFPIADLYTQYSKYKKIHSSFAKPFIDKSDEHGVLRGSFNQCGTVTGRLSSSNPNMQNIPSGGLGGDIRGLLGVQKGHKLVGGDLSNIEARILANYLEKVYKDSIMADAFRQGLDFHWENAKAWGVAVNPNTDNPKKDPGRSVAKTMLYCIMYGGGTAKIADMLGVSESTANYYVSTFEKNCPSVNLLKEKVWSTLKKRGYITTILNRSLYYPNINSKNKAIASRAQRQSFNALIQGSAADIFKDLSVKTKPICDKYGAKFVASVHDETLFSVPEEYADAFAKETTELWSSQNYLRIPVTAEFSAGDNWNEVK